MKNRHVVFGRKFPHFQLRAHFFAALLKTKLWLLAPAILIFPIQGRCAFTNSGTLGISQSGTNVVVSYSLSTTQGWVTLQGADTLQGLASNPGFINITKVPPSRQGQFLVPFGT